MEYKYIMTVVIPCKNGEKHISRCLDSIINQSLDNSKIETIVIDDASEDGTAQILAKYQTKFDNIKVIHNEKSVNVSKARNMGINNATGKYIMFLDADDELSSNTVASISGFFDQHYEEIDLVTYKIKIKRNDGRKTVPHYRFQFLTHDGVYDLTLFQNAFINQTTINVCIKNKGDKTPLFDPQLVMHEDQFFIIESLLEKCKIGYCSKGKYIYYRHESSAVSTRMFAYYIFEPTMKKWEQLFLHYKGKKVPYFLQAYFFNDIYWKMKADRLIPYHYDEDEMSASMERLRSLLNYIDDEIIIKYPPINGYHIPYFILQKSNFDIQKKFGPNMLTILNHDKVILQEDIIKVVITNLKIKNGVITMQGAIRSGAMSFFDKPRLFAVLTSKKKGEIRKEIELRDSGYNYYLAKQKTNCFWLFDIEIKAIEEGIKQFYFLVSIDDILFDTKCKFKKETLFSDIPKRYVYFEDGMKYSYKDGLFLIKKIKVSDPETEDIIIKTGRWKQEPDLQKERKKIIRHLKKYKNEIWLYSDCKGVERDNGYYQFEHDFSIKDGIERYYVIADDFKKSVNKYPSEMKKYLVEFGSDKHKVLYLTASKIIAAYIEKNNYIPFSEEEYPKYVDLGNVKEIIYLQHGILHAHMPWKYSIDRLGIDREVISSEYERINLIKNYGFLERNLIPSGMPRYDFIDSESKPTNRIIFAPSWRSYLIKQMDNGDWVAIDDVFKKSEYYSGINKLINSDTLIRILEDNDLYLDVKMHPIFERYQGLFTTSSERIQFVHGKVDEKMYCIYITDFSSFTFDFAYLKRPIVYFLPDKDKFLSGMNLYRELDLPLEEGFGPVADNELDICSAIETIVNRGFVPEEQYLKKMEPFFLYKDNKQRDRLYQSLIGDQKR